MMFFLIFYILLSLGLYKIFEKAGEDAWKGLVPGLNFVVWAKLIGRPAWWAALLLIPLVNIFIFAGMAVDMVRSFGKLELWHSALAVIFAPLFFIYLGFSKEEKYEGPILVKEKEYQAALETAQNNGEARQLKKLQHNNPYTKSPFREWVEAIVFAVFAAAFIRMFLIEAYVIPTPSMEGSLLVGDFLFVSKMHYGIRTPETVAMIPLLHNRIPFLNRESYLKSPKLDYHRLPALEKIERNKPVVFNYPEGDSVYVFADRTWSIHDYRRNAAPPAYMQAIKTGRKPLTVRPMDKKDHYIKRCVGVGGDSLEIRDRQLYINGQKAENPTHLQFLYQVNFPPGSKLNTSKFSEWGISSQDVYHQEGNMMLVFLSEGEKEKVIGMGNNITAVPFEIGKMDRNPNKAFPHDSKNFPGWTVDNYGPIYIPEQGATVDISMENISMYERIINVYEDNDFEKKGGKIYINGEVATSYTFKQNYYWMMGDNRHNSEDSRIWGFVPEDHVVGKPLFIWFSTKEGSIGNGIRWNRIFSSADKR